MRTARAGRAMAVSRLMRGARHWLDPAAPHEAESKRAARLTGRLPWSAAALKLKFGAKGGLKQRVALASLFTLPPQQVPIQLEGGSRVMTAALPLPTGMSCH